MKTARAIARLPRLAVLTAGALWLACAGSAAADAKATVRGDLPQDLRARLVLAIGQTDDPPSNRFEARRRARAAMDTVEALLRSEGYYQSKLEDVVEGDERPQAIVSIETGPRFVLAAPAIQWTAPEPEAEVVRTAQADIALTPGDPGRAADVIAGEGRVIASLTRQGYPDAATEPRRVVVDHASMTVAATYRINAGLLVRLDGVRLETAGPTNPDWVSHLAPWTEGQRYNPEDVAELERRLLETGVYDGVSVALSPPEQATATGTRPVVVTLTDRPRKILEAGATFSTADGSGVEGLWTWYNRFGRADTLRFQARLADLNSRLGVDLSLPHWRQPGQTLALSAAIVNEDTDAYRRTAGVLSADLRQRLGKTSWYSYGVGLDAGRYSENRFDPVTQAPLAIDRDLAILTGRASAYIDQSNDPLNPSQGWRLTMNVQPTAVTGEDTIVFVRAEAQATAYTPLDPKAKTVLAGRLRLGSIVGGSELSVPSDRLFYSGGGGSVRGYEYQGVGPRLPDNTPRGGVSLFEVSAEVRRDIGKGFGAVAFIDAGSVGFSETPDFSNLRYSVGVGARYNLSFGPIRADIAFPVDKREGDSNFQVYVSIGQAFLTDATPETPVPETPAPEAPAKAEKRRRTRVQAIAFIGGMIAAGLAVVLLILAVGGRIYLISGPGRDLITSFVAGKKIGRYGRINVEGLSGDLFDDFTLARVTVTDAKGVWLEAKNVHVDWDYPALITRRFHATAIEADTIRLLRRPEVDPPDGKPPKPMPLSIDIDRYAANVELMEGFSKEYGRWRLSGDANVPRAGSKTAAVNAYSLNRPGDYLRVTATFGGKMEDLRLNLRANEAQGGPLAGALGYSPDQPFMATALVNGDIVDAVVRTGDFTPLTVKGRYGETGSRISGFFDFSGSDLLEPFVRRIGGTARFGFAAVPDRNDKTRQGMAWRLISDNLTSSAQGFVNIKDRTSDDGVRVQVSTGSLTRLIGSTTGGPATYSAMFTGDASTWKLDGDVRLTNADLASYSATTVAGPLDISADAGRYDLDGDLSVAGGRSAGIVGALLGARPHVVFEAARLKDGALLLEKIDARGQALTVTGSGGRSLAGGLGFRGRADITDISKIRPGARGAFGGPIQASSARGGAPWRLTFDGRGVRLASGMAELDRLLGATPRLQLTGGLIGGRIAIDQAVLNGAAGQATARGLIEPEGRLRLALTWNARGPFGVGPVAIDGAMTGQGALTGTLAQPRADLTAAFGSVKAGALTLTDANLILSFRKGTDASDGRVVLTSGSNYGPARASGNFFLGGSQLRLSDVDLNAAGITAQGSLALANNTPSSADLNFTARPGAFLTAGSAHGRVRLTDATADGSAILDVQGRDVRFAGSPYIIRRLELYGQGSLAQLPFTLNADVGGPTPVSFDGTGVYSRDAASQSVTLSGSGRVREVAFATRNPAVIALAGDGRVVRVDLGIGGGVLLGELRQDSNAAVLQADLTSVELGSIAPDLSGRVTGRVSLRGAGPDLTGSANVTLAELRSRDAPRGLAVNGAVSATLIDDKLRIQANASGTDAVNATADVTLPVEASAAPFRLAIARTRPMSGEVVVRGQIQPIWDVFFGGERSLAGQVDGRAILNGTLNAPLLTGRLNLQDGRFRDNGTGLVLDDVTLASRFDDTTALVQTFTATDGSGGTVSGDGRIGLRQGSGSSFELTLNRFRIIDNDIAEGRASGPLTVVRAADGNITLAGEINVDEARIEANPPGSNGIVRMDVVEINRSPTAPERVEPSAASRGPQIGLDIRLRSRGGNVRVVGRGLNVSLSVNARVRGTVAQPVLGGNARIVRGDYEFAGKRFVFDDRGAIALSTDPARIRLNLSAVREDPALTATIRVTGTAALPVIVLTSTPQLPQDEILSQVLFGRSASQLSPFEAAQLAAGVASLAGGGGFDVIGNLRELAGLDRLSFGGEASALTVAGGRYITDDVYLEIIGGGEGGAAVNVEWQVRRNLAISSKFGGQGDATLSIRWRRQSAVPGTGRTDRRPNADADADD